MTLDVSLCHFLSIFRDRVSHSTFPELVQQASKFLGSIYLDLLNTEVTDTCRHAQVIYMGTGDSQFMLCSRCSYLLNHLFSFECHF